METKKLDGVQVWKEFEDVSAWLGLNVIERAVYSWLLRHTRLEGKLRERFTVTEVADKVGISKKPALQAIRRLADHGALRFIERSYSGHRLEVRLPAQIPAVRRARDKAKTNGASPSGLRASRSKPPSEPNFEEMDFFVSPALRKSIHEREDGKCFYCMCRTTRGSRCLDHVVPRAKSGQNSYRNVVSCCAPCNWQKKDRLAADFLRELYREGRLSHKDLGGRLRQLQSLAAGNLRPPVSSGPVKPST
ncbi:MAG TPA: HNH endonuclease signature motif containing protein [Candidatus Acidoferrum sp.]|nr:HNH endonuclease signature motif containing protein [Candidatus Acidoferrum sp.]